VRRPNPHGTRGRSVSAGGPPSTRAHPGRAVVGHEAEALRNRGGLHAPQGESGAPSAITKRPAPHRRSATPRSRRRSRAARRRAAASPAPRRGRGREPGHVIANAQQQVARLVQPGPSRPGRQPRHACATSARPRTVRCAPRTAYTEADEHRAVGRFWKTTGRARRCRIAADERRHCAVANALALDRPYLGGRARASLGVRVRGHLARGAQYGLVLVVGVARSCSIARAGARRSRACHARGRGRLSGHYNPG